MGDLAEAKRLLEQIKDESLIETKYWTDYSGWHRSPAFTQLLLSPREERLAVLKVLAAEKPGLVYIIATLYQTLFEQIIRSLDPPLDLTELVEISSHLDGYQLGGSVSIRLMADLLQRMAETDPDRIDEIRMLAGVLHRANDREWPTVAERRHRSRLAMLEQGNPGGVDLGEDWLAPFRNRPEPWTELLKVWDKTRGTQAGPKWTASLKKVVGNVPAEELLEAVEESLELVRKSQQPVDASRSDFVRGMMWTLAHMENSTRLLGRALAVYGKRLPGLGIQCAKGFSGALDALIEIGSDAAIAELSMARPKVKGKNASDQLRGALQTAAQRAQKTVAEVEELVLPSFGLGADRTMRADLGDSSAILEIGPMDTVSLRWFKADREVKSPPQGSDPDGVAEVKRAKKEVETALSSLRRRTEELFLDRRQIPYAHWRSCYLDHPLASGVTRRLIWVASWEDQAVRFIPRPERWMDQRGEEVEIPETATIRLWHPIEAEFGEVEAWRDLIFRHELAQPFKQAFREVYYLTDAEIRTRTYSNRFAGHILKQHLVRALVAERRWEYALQGQFDGSSDGWATLRLPEWGLFAKYYMEPAGDEATELGISLYVASDQVRFVQSNYAREEAVTLTDVPPVVFSEVMRDVDLFVGRGSIALDEGWEDQGERPVFRQYWQKHAFGDLGATAQTRRDVLQRILPRLKISERCRIEDRFLIVSGHLRNYKIHLGSGNILMSPNDQYLCIVPGQETEAKIGYLPFEGDRVLAIILSKAFMLADDMNIADPTIVSQIRRYS